MALSVSLLDMVMDDQGFTTVLVAGRYLVSVSFKFLEEPSISPLPKVSVELAIPRPDMIFQEVSLFLPNLIHTPNKPFCIN